MATSKHRVAESGAVYTLTGTPGEIGKQLTRSNAQEAIALTFAHQDAAVAQAVAEALGSLAPLVADLVRRRQKEGFTRIVEALVPAMSPPRQMLIEARMAAQARSAVLASGEWLTAAQVAHLAGFSATNPSAQPNRWKKDGQIFAIRHQGSDYFPAWALDGAANYRPRRGLRPVLSAFGDSKDGWGLAYWFTAVNSMLGGVRPQDLLGVAPERVLAAALDEMADVAHA